MPRNARYCHGFIVRAFHRTCSHHPAQPRKPRDENLVSSVVRFASARLSLFTREEENRCDTSLYEIHRSNSSIQTLLGKVPISGHSRGESDNCVGVRRERIRTNELERERSC